MASIALELGVITMGHTKRWANPGIHHQLASTSLTQRRPGRTPFCLCGHRYGTHTHTWLPVAKPPSYEGAIDDEHLRVLLERPRNGPCKSKHCECAGFTPVVQYEQLPLPDLSP